MKKLSIIIAASVLFLGGCTQNQRARSFGGTATIELDRGRKLVNVTFKQDSLWVLTREAKQGESPEIYIFKEDSSFGLMEGKVIIKEKL